MATNFYKAAFSGKYIQGAGALSTLPELINHFGEKALIITTKTPVKHALEPVKANLPAGTKIELFGGECCTSEIERINGIIESGSFDVIIGLGGGKTLDTAKICADQNGCRVIIAPTIASTDAPHSGCAVIYTEDGVFERMYFQKNNPDAVLVDSQVIANAPVRFLVAGMGNALATWFEARSCKQTRSENVVGGISPLTGIAMAQLCYNTLMEYGTAAKLACERHVVTPALDYIIEANILLSGIGFESSGLAAAHSIHDGLTALEETHDFYHGEKVAFGVLAGLHLNGEPVQVLEEVYRFCELVGLPTTLSQIGLSGCSHDDLLKAAKRACDPVESIHHEAVEITPQNVAAAMNAADAYGMSHL
ncbi:MAG: glycerol dehydrogenase [Lentisphaerae bacterium]|nr:glycerol dehydrogenase [Lentisphaerota bacterium]MCP4101023.1 glycerol dehydrogenase [Lentisphaerota bacterium]